MNDLLKRLELEGSKSLDPQWHNIFKQFTDYIREYAKESERGKILLLSAHIDEQLVTLLKKFLKPSRKRDDWLFGRMGPLSSFSTRIEMAQRLGLISVHTASALDTLREIRNKCAHTKTEISIKKSPLREHYNNFVSHTLKSNNYFKKLLDQRENQLIPKNDLLLLCLVHLCTLDLLQRSIEQLPDQFSEEKLALGKGLLIPQKK